MKTKTDIASKPYYRCFVCKRFRNSCGGRPTRDMDLKEWCEYIRDIRDYFGLTNAYLTEKAESSTKTTERIMAGTADQDIMRATARRYEKAAIGAVGDFTCRMDYSNDEVAKLQEELAKAKETIAYWKQENDRKAKVIDKLIG